MNKHDEESSIARAGLPRNVKVMGLASLLNDVASEAIYPLMPTFLLSLGGSKTLLGLLEGLADTTSSLLKLWAGHVSDRAGQRKGFIVFGYSLTSISRPLMAFSTVAYHVLLIRLCDRIGKGLRSAPRDALIAESTPRTQHGRAFGFHRAMDHLGAAIGPALATLFLWFLPGQVRLLMLATIVPGILVVILQAFFLREERRQSPSTDQEPLTVPSMKKERFRFPTGSFRQFLLALLLFTFANSTDVFLLVRAEEVGIPVLWLPMLWGCFHVLKSGGNYWLGTVADRRNPKTLIVVGWILYAVVYAGFGFANDTWQVCALFGLYAIFYSLTEPAEKKLVARAIKMQSMVDRGEVKDYVELARLAQVTSARMTQIMNLNLLSPAIQEALLFLEPEAGRVSVTLKGLQKVCLEADWQRQTSGSSNPIELPNGL